jgi:hypothetical protein
MGLIFDDEERIKEAKSDDYLSHLMRLATEDDNRNGSCVLKKAGLSSYLNKYSQALMPFSYNISHNKEYQNENTSYAPEMVFDQLFSQIDSADHQHQFLFLKTLVEQISNFDRSGFELTVFNRYLAMLGYEITKCEISETNGYTLEAIDAFLPSEKGDLNAMERLSNKLDPSAFQRFQEAISNFRNGEFASAIDNSRLFLEKVINAKDSTACSLAEKILNISGESFVLNGKHYDNRKDIFEYWLSNKKGANRYRSLITLYSALSGLGPHGESTPTFEDALFFMETTQAAVYWICTKR